MRGDTPALASRRAYRQIRRTLAVIAVAGGLSACATVEIAPAHLMPLPQETMALLGKKHMDVKAPIFIRVYKEESELEVWKMRDDGRFYHLKTFPICNWSGQLGPKLRQGDRQAPEGFYTITRHQLNPNSQYHLAINLGYPNPYDKSNRRTGDSLMIHGGCGSSGCYAMTDALMEEVYALVREAMDGGQAVVHVHALPFRMTKANMARHTKSQWQGFWRTLKEGYDYFETTRQVPTIAVCNRHYVVNVRMAHGDPARLNPAGACPTFQHPKAVPFKPKPGEHVAEVDQRVVVPGRKRRTPTSGEWEAPMMGLTKTPQAVYDWWQRLTGAR
ncbi:MAG TPA: murein L,D-transpeptidase family protein [Hyphomicrobiaceae bacterium]|nr:murein L,D-transpeptidase family protein [Hyphomicrobiaceae bacterium]